MRRFGLALGVAITLASGTQTLAATPGGATLQGSLTGVYTPTEAVLYTLDHTGRIVFDGGGEESGTVTGYFDFRYIGDRPTFQIETQVDPINRGVIGVETYFELTYQFAVNGPTGLVPLNIFTAGSVSAGSDETFLPVDIDILARTSIFDLGVGQESRIYTCTLEMPECLNDAGEIDLAYHSTNGLSNGYSASGGWNETYPVMVEANRLYTVSMYGMFRVFANEGPSYASLFLDPSFTIDETFGDRDLYEVALSAQVAAIPEPAAWALMLVGFGASGLAIRRRRPARAVA